MRTDRPLVMPRCTAILLLLTAAGLSFAQSPGGSPPAEQAHEQFQVIFLKHTQAPLVANTIMNVFGNQGDQISAVSDERLNAVVLRAPKELTAEIMELIQTLDREETERWQVKIFPLRNTTVAPAVLDTLSSVIDPATRISIDKMSNAIIATGPPSSLQVIEAVLQRLDTETPARTAPTQEVQVRVVWLVSGTEDDQGSDPPKDLDNVVNELKRFGIDNLKLAAQVLVSAVEGERFQASGMTEFVATGASLQVSGMLAEPNRDGAGAKPGRALQLQLSVGAHQSNGGPLCELDTSIKAPLGQCVVLGATPVNTHQSAFVVQLVGPKRAEKE